MMGSPHEAALLDLGEDWAYLRVLLDEVSAQPGSRS
jgi:hypothetical protein